MLFPYFNFDISISLNHVLIVFCFAEFLLFCFLWLYVFLVFWCFGLLPFCTSVDLIFCLVPLKTDPILLWNGCSGRRTFPPLISWPEIFGDFHGRILQIRRSYFGIIYLENHNKGRMRPSCHKICHSASDSLFLSQSTQFNCSVPPLSCIPHPHPSSKKFRPAH